MWIQIMKQHIVAPHAFVKRRKEDMDQSILHQIQSFELTKLTDYTVLCAFLVLGTWGSHAGYRGQGKMCWFLRSFLKVVPESLSLDFYSPTIFFYFLNCHYIFNSNFWYEIGGMFLCFCTLYLNPKVLMKGWPKVVLLVSILSFSKQSHYKSIQSTSTYLSRGKN